PVLDHAIDWLERESGSAPDIVVHLRPTSPIRPPDCVDAAIELLLGDPSADSVRGVVLAAQNPHKMWRLEPDGSMTPLLTVALPEPDNQPRQGLPPAYWQTRPVDAVRTTPIPPKRPMTGEPRKPPGIHSAHNWYPDNEAER